MKRTLEQGDQESNVIVSSIKKKVKYTKLFAVLLRNNVDELQKLLEGSEYLINETPTDKMFAGKTLLYKACQLARIECVKLLLAYGARTDVICDQFLAIDAACETCNPELIKLLYHNPIGIEFSCWILSFIKGCCNQDIDAVRLAVEVLQKIAFVPCENYDFLSLQAFVATLYANLSTEGVISFFLGLPKNNDIAHDTMLHNISISTEVSWLRHCVAVFKKQYYYSWAHLIDDFIKSNNTNDLRLLPSIVPGGLIGRHISYCLGMASALGSVEIVAVLLEYCTDLHYRNPHGDTALHRTHVSNAQQLIDHGAQIEAINRNEATPLHRACASGELAFVELLLNNGADITAVTRHGYTPLHLVCTEDSTGSRLGIVRALLERDITLINAVDDRGQTALMRIELDKNTEMSNLLLQYGANTNLYYDDGTTLLLRAVNFSQQAPDHIHLLLQHGADINQGNRITGKTPLLKACQALNGPELVKLLLDAGADVDAPADDNGNSVLTILADSPGYGRVRSLCEQYINTQPVMK